MDFPDRTFSNISFKNTSKSSKLNLEISSRCANLSAEKEIGRVLLIAKWREKNRIPERIIKKIGIRKLKLITIRLFDHKIMQNLIYNKILVYFFNFKLTQ